MSATTTARREVLTAEVRVLMPGAPHLAASLTAWTTATPEPWGRISDNAEANDTVTAGPQPPHRVAPPTTARSPPRSALTACEWTAPLALLRSATTTTGRVQAHQREIAVAEECARIADEWPRCR